ncbi:MAG TPA: hypothetical protein ENN89_03390 [Synergistetes bacterium]|nr:hypothetical protein [Synergistota bacterium]
MRLSAGIMLLIAFPVLFLTSVSLRADAQTLTGSVPAIEGTLIEIRNEVLRGLEKVLRDPSGLLFTNTSEKSFLSETVGLEMMLHLHRKDRAAFDRQFRLVESHFLGPLGLMAWKIGTEPGSEELWNASVDDLRVAKALVLADREWSSADYRKTALAIGESLLKHNTEGNLLIDGCSWKKPGLTGKSRVDQKYTSSTLAYADITAIRLLSNFAPEWIPVLQRMSGVLVEGMVDRECPLWLFESSSGKYEDTSQDDEIIGRMMAMLYLAEAGFVSIANLDSTTCAAVSGKLLDNYGNENISVISLAALYLFHGGRKTEALQTLLRLGNFRNDIPVLSGLLGYEESEEVYSAWAFDNLLALLAIETVLGNGSL